MQNAVIVLAEKMFYYYHVRASSGCDAQINLFLIVKISYALW
ncbi:hypothetical protein APHMUC_1119 [Anaplasma phagocytophilum str. ApMUC09]|uniref:Uncharacterized protein n=1 Tax=Anaplasma phagocytophilum str. ApMUC09 TaxID=1359152 RepID=A0A0F3N7M9_ANAPH|nr:hypothetical protein APHMUC_1119 [Anaplasma phagocytophilum str. ApMUC09]